MNNPPELNAEKTAANPLALGALGRAFATVGNRRNIEDWQVIGSGLIAKAGKAAPDLDSQADGAPSAPNSVGSTEGQA